MSETPTQPDEPTTTTKRRGYIQVDMRLYSHLGEPATNEEWHDALLLPDRYEVEQWERTQDRYPYDVFKVWVLSEDIPIIVFPTYLTDVELSLTMRSIPNEDYTARTVNILRIDFSYWDGNRWQAITGKEEVNPPSRVIEAPLIDHATLVKSAESETPL